MKKKMQFLVIVSFSIIPTIWRNLHDAKCKRRLKHRALPVDIEAVTISRNGKEAEVLAVLAVGREAGAVRICDSAQAVDTADEGANEEQIDKGDEFGRVARARVQK